MSIGFDSDDVILEKLRERLRRITDEELIRFGKDVRKLAENPIQRQLEAVRAEWRRKRNQRIRTADRIPYFCEPSLNFSYISISTGNIFPLSSPGNWLFRD